MNSTELDRAQVLNSLPQQLARLAHLLKAKYRFKEQAKIDWLAQFIEPDCTILDIGANFGVFAKSFSRIHNSSCRVEAFEPVGYNFGILSSVTRPFSNIRIHNLALSDAAGQTDIFIPVKEKGRIGPALAHLGQEKQRSYYREPISTVRLDDFVAQHKLGNIGFIKCDVEGAELLVFKGAAATLEAHKPPIFTELDGSYTQRLGYEPEELVQFLCDLGYAVNRVNKGDGQFSITPVDGYQGSGDYFFSAATA